MNDDLLRRFTQHDTGSTPREAIHPPEGIEWQHEGEDWDDQDIEDHPSNHVPLPPEDEHDVEVVTNQETLLIIAHAPNLRHRERCVAT